MITVRAFALVLLVVQAALLVRFVVAHPRMPKVTLLPLGIASVAMFWSVADGFSGPWNWSDTPAALAYSVTVIAILLPHMEVRK